MTDDVRAAAERITRSVHEAVYTGPLSLQGKLADALIVADAVLAEHPADDGDPVTGEWLEVVIPGFSLNAGGQMGGCVYDSYRVTAVRKDGGWGIVASVAEGEAGVLCPTRGHVRRLCAALGIPLTETPK